MGPISFLFNSSIIEFVGVIAAAASGIIIARNQKMDIVGVFFVAMVTALGGGTLRDILIDRHPIFWLRNDIYPVSILVLSFVSMVFFKKTFWNLRTVKWSLLVLDAVSLGFFSILGCQLGLEKGASLSVCVMMGVITGTFGGVIRDIICNTIPTIFGPLNQLYATCSFFGAVLYLMLLQIPLTAQNSSIASIIFIIVMRLIALVWNVSLPGILTKDTADE